MKSLAHLKKSIRIGIIVIGAILLAIEWNALTKNYYIQSTGIICVMFGVFALNRSIPSKQDESSVSPDKITNE